MSCRVLNVDYLKKIPRSGKFLFSLSPFDQPKTWTKQTCLIHQQQSAECPRY